MRLTREECYEVLEVDEDATIEQIRSASIPNDYILSKKSLLSSWRMGECSVQVHLNGHALFSTKLADR
jgi:hypothetical protein